MSFQDMVQQDIDAVFFQEFAQEHEIDGNKMLLVIDNDQLEDLKAKSQYADALYNASLLFYVKEKDLGYRPANKSTMRLDDKLYRVFQTDFFADGVYQIILEVPE